MAKKNAGVNGGGTRERIAVVAGLRTPFAKMGTAYRDMSAYELGRTVVAELLARTELDAREVGLCVYGQVVPSVSAPNTHPSIPRSLMA